MAASPLRQLPTFANYFIVSVLLRCWCACHAATTEPVKDIVTPPAYDTFIVIPLRVHVLTSADLPDVNCKLADSDIDRILGKVNGIWHNAGIHFGLESIVREEATRQTEFRDIRGNGPAPLELFPILRPTETQSLDGLHVYYVHQLPVNGVFMGRDFAFVKETAALRPVPGGIDEPIPRVTAHELGHALSLLHRQAMTNLMASGTTGTRLNSDEVAQVRENALTIRGAATVATWKRSAADALTNDDRPRARQIWSWLAALPGDDAADAGRERDRLQATSTRSSPK